MWSRYFSSNSIESLYFLHRHNVILFPSVSSSTDLENKSKSHN